MHKRLIAASLTMALLGGSLALAAGFRLRFHPKVGTWVPYKAVTAMTIDGMGGQIHTAIRSTARFEDKVEESLPDGSVRLSRRFTSLRAAEEGGEEQEMIQPGDEPIVLDMVRNSHGVLTSLNGEDPSQLALGQLLPLQGDPTYLMGHMAFLMVPYPGDDLDVGSEWDAGQGMLLMGGITEIAAPTRVREVTTGDPAFAVTETDLTMSFGSTVDVPGPGGQPMRLSVEGSWNMMIEQWTAMSNGLVATSKSSGRMTVKVGPEGQVAIPVEVDPFECEVSFDDQAFQGGNNP